MSTSPWTTRGPIMGRALVLGVMLLTFVALGADAVTDHAVRVGARAVAGPVGAKAAQQAPGQIVSGSTENPPRPVYAVRMVPRGYEPDPLMTPEAVGRAVAGASAYWSEQTRGAVSFHLASVSDWIAGTRGCGDPSALWAEALDVVPEAAEPRAHLLVVAPGPAGEESTGCDYGFGSLGVLDSGGSTYVTALHPELLAHELGHNLGLGHAAALECATSQDGRYGPHGWAPGCSVKDYDDLYDVMGYSGEGFGGGYLGVVGLDALGVDPTGIRRVHATTRGVRLLPISEVGRGVRGLRIDAPGEPVYYVEYRTGVGRDAAVAHGPWRPSTGVRVLRSHPEGHGAGLELDTSPGGRRYDRALLAGQSFSSASGRVRIVVVGADAEGAEIDVVVSGS